MKFVLSSILVAILSCLFVVSAVAECPPGFQPEDNICISQRMAEFLVCVTRSGGNRKTFYEIINKIIKNGGNKGGSAEASGGLLHGGGSLNFSKENEEQMYSYLSETYNAGAMETCRKVLKDEDADNRRRSQRESEISGADCYNPLSSSPALILVHGEFTSQLKNFKDELGDPTNCVKLIYRASKSNFQKATELWTFTPSEFYLLNPTDGSWQLILELERCEEFSWCRNEQTRERFFKGIFGQRSIPSGYSAPFGATAVYLSKSPDKFKNIGWLHWNCEMNVKSGLLPTLYQKFEHGIALGVYPVNNFDKTGQVYILTDDGQNKKFHLLTVKVDGSTCEK